MSLYTTERILQDMNLNLNETEKQIIDEDLNKEFGFIGFDHCEELDYAYDSDPEGVKNLILKLISKNGIRKEKEIEIKRGINLSRKML